MELYPFQETGVEYIRKHKYVLLGDEMGLGKTIQALAALKGKEGPVLVVCPAFLRKNWSNEVEGLSVSMKGYDFDPTICKKPEHFCGGLFEEETIYICGYDTLSKIPDFFKPKHVIFDEAHYLKNLKTIRTQAAHDLIAHKRPETCVLLSGTPIKNRVPEFYSILGLLSYCPTDTNGLRIREKSQYAFNIKFTHPTTRTIHVRDQVRDITEFHGVRNVELLKKYLEKKYLRRLAKSVLDLPPITTKEILFADSLQRDKQYLEAYAKYEETGVMTTLKAELACAKVKHTCNYAMDLIEQDEPLVIFTDHVAPVRQMQEFFHKKNITCVAMTGATPAARREELVSLFQSGEAQVLVATLGSAAVGYTMTKARNLIFNDYPWVPANLDQARKRIHRIGQLNRCVIHMILGSKCDSYILNMIKQKTNVLRKVL